MTTYINGKKVSKKFFDNPMYREYKERSNYRNKFIKESEQHFKLLYIFLLGIILGLTGNIIANFLNSIIGMQKLYIQVIYYTIASVVFILITMLIIIAIRNTMRDIVFLKEDGKLDRRSSFDDSLNSYKQFTRANKGKKQKISKLKQ